uniref:Uncharacterized protein LOC105129062 isoform X2 n=1 Tax=Rhizophora mucronata TaxID=61149 RepID=A0A2P2JTJ6_RHIMU
MERRSPKSPFSKSPIPKSPVLYEKYKSRCAYGFINFFHFRRSNSKKLISNRRHLSRDAIDDEGVQNKSHLLSNVDEKCQSNDDEADHCVAADSGDMEVRKVIGESIEQQVSSKINAAKVEHANSSSEFINEKPWSRRKAKKTCHRPLRLPIYGCHDVTTMAQCKQVQENLVDKSSKKDCIKPPEVSSNQLHLENRRDVSQKQPNKINLQFHMNDTAEAFINQKLIDGENLTRDGPGNQPKHFLDALEVLNANKDLFIKLLQDPNSLLAKHIEDLRDSQSKKRRTKCFREVKPQEHQRCNSGESEAPVCTQSIKSRNKSLSNETGDRLHLEEIVVLRPGHPSLHNCTDNNSHDYQQPQFSIRNLQQSVKPSFFPFVRMKRKLMRAMRVSREDQQLRPNDGSVNKPTNVFDSFKRCTEKTGFEAAEIHSADRKSSDNGGMIVSSEDVRRKGQINKVNGFEPGFGKQAASVSKSSHENSNSENVKHPKQMNYEASFDNRLHLSELLNDRNVNIWKKQRPKTWDGISSIPEYDCLSLISLSPKNKRELGFVTPQMKFSLWSDYQTSRRRPNTAEKDLPDTKVHEIFSSLDSKQRLRDSMKVVDSISAENPEQITSSEVPFENALLDNNACQDPYTTNKCGENGSVDFSRLCAQKENQKSPSTYDYCSSPTSNQRIEEFEGTNDCVKQPSPVSVLEQFFVEDITSPVRIEWQPGLPLQYGAEEDDSAADGSVFKHIGRALHASGLNWDELSLKFNLSDQLLDQSLIDEVMCSDPSYGDQRLLFDYINEVLLEVCQCHLISSPWVSFTKQRIQPIKKPENMIHEVMKHVHCSLLLQPPLQTLQQLVERDLSRSGTWIDIRADIEDVVGDMVESIIQELVIEAVID